MNWDKVILTFLDNILGSKKQKKAPPRYLTYHDVKVELWYARFYDDQSNPKGTTGVGESEADAIRDMFLANDIDP